MIELCCLERLALETRQRGGVARGRGAEEFECHHALEGEVPGFVDLAHAPGSERAAQLVMRDPLVIHFRSRSLARFDAP